MDDWAALRLQLEWGVDEALEAAPLDRFRAPADGPSSRAAVAPAVAPRPGPDPAPGPGPAEADSLDALHAALAAFEGCALRTTATHTVRWDGNPEAGLVVVGDAPGADDDRSGRAFSGPAGEVLDRVLRTAGLDRSALLLTTLVPWRPPGNRPLTEAEIRACLPFTLRLLALVRPRRLLLLGTAPLRTLSGTTETPRRVRGRWLPVAVPGLPDPIPALALPPLDQWLRSPTAKRELWNDLLALQDVLGTS